MCGSKSARELLEVLSINKENGYGHKGHHSSRPTLLMLFIHNIACEVV